MVEEKGLAPESADKIGGFVQGNAGGGKELWAKLTEENKFGDHPVRQILGRLERSHVEYGQYSDRCCLCPCAYETKYDKRDPDEPRALRFSSWAYILAAL